MIVALTVWGKRISPVFDSAQRLLISEIENSKVINRTYKTFDPESTHQLTSLLNKQKISVLICGAISEEPANMIETCGIKLIPFISGTVDEVLQSYAQRNSIIPTYLMPGCRRNRQRQSKNKGEDMSKKNGTGTRGSGKGSGKGRRMSDNGCRKNGSGQGKGQDNASSNGRRKGVGSGQGRSKNSAT